MSITAAELETVAGGLRALGAELDASASMASAMICSLGERCDGLDGAWNGPRQAALVGAARLYRTAVDPFPAAVRSACETVARWTTTATELAGQLRRAELTALYLEDEATRADDAGRERVQMRLAAARSDSAELGALWALWCAGYAGELNGAIAAIRQANDAVVGEVAGWSTAVPAFAGLTTLASWAEAISVLFAVLEEARNREDEWNAVLEENGLEGGEWVPTTTITGTYGDTGMGPQLINLIHNAVANDIAHAASVLLAPSAVEGESAGRHSTDVVSPISVDEAIALGVPYMIAEVKAESAGNRRKARNQLNVAEEWAEEQGAEVIRIGEPDENGEPQLDNPQPFANGELQFPTSGVVELYPGVHVVYRLTEPGIYEYRIYATEPLPDPDEPLEDGDPMTFREQVRHDSSNQDRPTPAQVVYDQEVVYNFPRPVDEPPPETYEDESDSPPESPGGEESESDDDVDEIDDEDGGEDGDREGDDEITTTTVG